MILTDLSNAIKKLWEKISFDKHFKVIPQFCIAHSFCAYFNNKSLSNIFKMAAILLQKNKSKRARNGPFSELKRVSEKKNGVKT